MRRLRWLPGQARCSHFPLSFLRDTVLGAFLCRPSEGLQLFSCLMSVSLLFGSGVVQVGPAPPFWGLGRCGCSRSGGAAQVVLVSRDLAAVWEEKNTNTTIKWQDGACYGIKSGFMIFDLHLDFMCAESHCVHRHPAASPVGHHQGGDEDGCLSPTSPCVGKELGACVFLQMLLTRPSLDPPGLQFCPFYYQHQRLPPAPLCSLLLLRWLKSQPSASHLLLPCPSCLVASHVPRLSKTERHAPCALCSTPRMGGKRSTQAGMYMVRREGAQWSTNHRP